MQKLCFIIKKIWALLNFIREIIFNFIALLVILLVITGIGLWQNNLTPATIEAQEIQGALRLNLNGYLADRRPQQTLISSLKELDSDEEEPQKISTFDIIQTIRSAITDNRITGIVLELDHFSGGDITSINYIGNELEHFKNERNLPIIAIGSTYSQSAYLLASYADQVQLNPAGGVDIIPGLAQTSLYFKTLLNKLEITPHIFRVGTYKAAVEPFLRDDMSEAARSNTSLWLNGMWKNYTQQIAKNRNISPKHVLPAPQDYLKALRVADGDTANYAVNNKLVDELADHAQQENSLKQLFGIQKSGDYRHVNYKDYLTTLTDITYSDAPNKIVVVNIEGEITTGLSSDNTTGSTSILRMLKTAEKNPTVKGVIVRINSPGGSAFASELIRQQLAQLKQKTIPVVISMGGMAASGGYWIATAGDYIVADRNTITGSIGIFAAMFTAEKGLKSLGINSDSVTTSPFAETSVTLALPEAVNDAIQLSIEHGYQRFISLVAQSRQMNLAQVDNIAQGQVWLGEQAMKYGLVDELGNFDTAVKAMSKTLNLPLRDGETEVVFLTDKNEKNKFGSILNGVKSQTSAQLLQNIGLTPTFSKQLQHSLMQFGLLDQFNDPKGEYIYCLDCSVSF